ncbi:MAG: MFS transporter [Eggerthellaceae bacterium]|nr:MFS transporter [Eggerthellaceae bacterium]
MAGKAFNPKHIIVVAAFAAFLATFNETYLNVAFAPIMADLGVDVNTVQWLATAYMLGAAVMVPVSAFAYRSLPTRPLFCGTVALLVVGSVIAALAPNFPVLLIGRIVQSLGTGMLIPIGMNITLEAAPREKLGQYMGIMGAMTTLGPSVSVILAGVLLSIAPWRVLLWVFAGLSLLCLLSGAALLGNIAKLTHPKLDVASVILIGLALVGILYGVSTAFTGNLVVSVACIVVGIALLVPFVKRQRSLEQPLIDLRPLSVAPFAIGVVANMISLITIFSMNILVPTFMQSVLGLPSLTASLALFPAILLSCFASPVAGRIYDKHGAGTLLPVGFAMIALFTAIVSFIIPNGNVVLLAVCYIPVICGSALVIGPVQSFALSKLDRELNPHGVTVMSTGFQIAGCIGSSVFVGIYASVIASQMSAGADVFAASSSGFLWAGIAVAIVAVIGLVLALRIRGFEKAVSPATPAAGTSASMESGTDDSTLRSIMKTDVFALAPEQTVADALRLFVDKGISGAPVVDEAGKPVGFVSDGDIMRHLADQTPAFKSAYSFVVERENADFEATLARLMQMPVSAIATDGVVTVDASAGMGEVARVLADRRLKKAPVMEGGRMIGVINRSNVTKYSVNRYFATHNL